MNEDTKISCHSSKDEQNNLPAKKPRQPLKLSKEYRPINAETMPNSEKGLIPIENPVIFAKNDTINTPNEEKKQSNPKKSMKTNSKEFKTGSNIIGDSKNEDIISPMNEIQPNSDFENEESDDDDDKLETWMQEQESKEISKKCKCCHGDPSNCKGSICAMLGMCHCKAAYMEDQKYNKKIRK